MLSVIEAAGERGGRDWEEGSLDVNLSCVIFEPYFLLFIFVLSLFYMTSEAVKIKYLIIYANPPFSPSVSLLL